MTAKELATKSKRNFKKNKVKNSFQNENYLLVSNPKSQQINLCIYKINQMAFEESRNNHTLKEIISHHGKYFN